MSGIADRVQCFLGIFSAPRKRDGVVRAKSTLLADIFKTSRGIYEHLAHDNAKDTDGSLLKVSRL